MNSFSSPAAPPSNPQPSSPLLVASHLTKYFPVGSFLHTQHVHAVDDISFQVEQGQVVAVVGESGSGKSTTARLIARLIPVTQGEIYFHGENLLQTEARQASLAYRRKVQMIFQDPFSSLNPVHTIQHHLARPLLLHKAVRNGKQLQERIHDLLSIVGLNPPSQIASCYPHQLSGGQRQRVAFARALAVDPELILADEPISMLDVSIRIGILNLMAQLKEQRGIAYVYITHDLASARYLGDQILVMYAGHIVEGGGSEEVMHSPAHPYTQLLLSAVPDPHSGLHTGIGQQARGEAPVLIDPPPGCPFSPRCPRVMAACRQIMPAEVEASAGHWVRCHLYRSS